MEIKEFCMVKKSLFGMLTLIVGVMLVFALSGCNPDPAPQPSPSPSSPQGTWESSNITITGTWSKNTISFTYPVNSNSQGSLTKNSGGNTLDGVWNGTYAGDTIRVTVSGSNWTMKVLDSGSYFDYAKGTVTASGATLNIIVTHVMDYGSESVDSGSGEFIPPGGPIGPVGGGEESTG